MQTINVLTLRIVVIICLFTTSCSTLNQLNLKPSNFETVLALKEVLNSSTFRAIKTLNDVKNDGAIAIFPDEIQPVLKTLKTLGYGAEVDKISTQIASVSKLVAAESKVIMTDAIKEVSFTDAVSVVIGGEDAATAVLRQAMYGSVKKRYSSQLDTELDKTEAKTYWPLATGAYNIFAKNKIDNNLSDFMAERAVDALFLATGREEKKIRQDPASLGKTVVTKVFDYYGKNKK